MSPEHQQQERSHLQHEAEHSRPKKKSNVVSYLAILFAAAFLLLLLSYFMQHRSNEETISDLTNSMNNLQSLGNLVDQNKALLEKNQQLQEQLDKLTEEKNTLEMENSQLDDQLSGNTDTLSAMDWLWRIQRVYSRGAKADAKNLIASFEATGLPASLPQVSPSKVEGPAPADQYAAILSALGIRQTEP